MHRLDLLLVQNSEGSSNSQNNKKKRVKVSTLELNFIPFYKLPECLIITRQSSIPSVIKRMQS